MNESAKQIFGMKFAKLTLVLNAIFLLAALCILAAFRVIPVYSYQIAAICGVGAIVLALYFMTAYRRDKEWLMAQDNEPEKPVEPSGSVGEHTGDSDA